MRAFFTALIGIRDSSLEAEYRSEARIVAELVRQMASHELGRMFFGNDTGQTLFDNDFVIAIVPRPGFAREEAT